MVVARWASAWRVAVTVLCIAGVLTPAAAGAAADPEDKLDRVNDELDEARENLRGVERRHKVELADLQRIDARHAQLQEELDVVDGRLEVAEEALAESQQELERTTQRLLAVEKKLADTRERLDQHRDDFAERARSTYKFGGRSGLINLVVGVDSIEEFSRGLKYARAVLHDDQERVERVSALERTVERTTIEIAQLQDQQAAQRTIDAKRRDEAAEIVAEQAEITRAVAAEADKRRLLVAQLESDRDSYVAMVGELEAQGEQLEGELRRRAEAQRAAAAQAEARRQAALDDAQSADRGSPPAGDGALLWPASGPKTSNFGWRTHPIFGTRRFHAGIDIGAGSGASIYAADSGTVVSAGSRGGYGNTIVIDHGNGMATLYAHQSSFAVSSGASVSRGQVIGYVGSTGYSTGPHLHFEVRIDGAAVDPMRYF